MEVGKAVIPLDRTGIRPNSSLRKWQRHLDAADDVSAKRLVKSEQAAAAWRSMRGQYLRAQHYKCGWCESLLDDRDVEMDHIRPKDGTRYWWLAFSAANLLASCRTCNNYKWNRWPITPGAPRLAPRAVPDGHNESALVIDPTRPSEPLSELTYVYAAGRWRIAGTSPRARATIDTLDLDREGLRRQINSHVALVLDVHVRILIRALKDGDREGYDRASSEMLELCRPHQPYAALNRVVFREALLGNYLPG